MVTLAAKLSADVGNGLSFGSDNGLYGQALAAPPRSGSFGISLDNSEVAAGQSWIYAQPTAGNNGALYGPLNNGGAVVWPVSVARAARLTAAWQSIQTAGAGSTIYNSLFAADPATGLPAGKINDWFTVAGGTAGATAATVLDAVTVLQPHTRYWVLSWVYTTSAYPTVQYRQNATAFVGLLPRAALPTAAAGAYATSGGPVAYAEASVSYTLRTAAPTALGITPGSTLLNYCPYTHFQLVNV